MNYREHFTTLFDYMQYQKRVNTEEKLEDYTEQGRKRPWEEKRVKAEELARLYQSIGYKEKARRLRQCGQVLTFARTEKGLKLINGGFCRVRLCPVCQWRRALKIQGQMRKILEREAWREQRYLFLTLTVRNCRAEELSAVLTAMAEGWNRLTKYAAYRTSVEGAYRGLELTRNPDTGEFHPHYHCILAVKKSYFSGAYYIPYAEWRELWAQALGAGYAPQINVKPIKGDDPMQGILETCKYTVKETDYITGNDKIDRETLKILDSALDKRRLVSLSGTFREAQRALKLTDPENPNLRDEKVPEDAERVSYVWSTGYRAYYRLNPPRR